MRSTETARENEISMRAKWKAMSPTERDVWIEQNIMNRPGKYTTDRLAALELYEAMVERGCVISLYRESGNPQHCAIWDAEKPARIIKTDAETIPDAIGEAAAIYISTYGNKKE
ncbi:MAG TPA: hypothetical protein PKA10_07915 [Selenomonadales bacterium]|nr:hypothetical protein [Selenomonadales bacterium]